MGGSAQWDGQVADWSARQEVITVDLPGFGENNDRPVLSSIGDFADWVISDLRAKGVEKYHLLGHSMGGMIVQEMVRRDHDRIVRLVLYGTGAVGVLPGRFETIAESKARAQADGAKQTARRISATWFLHGDKAANYDACASIAERATSDAISAGLDAMQAWSGEDYLPQITPKTLLIWGDKDRTYPWSQTNLLWESIPDAELAVVPGCAHAVHLEKAAIFNRIVDDFLCGSDALPAI
jgi:pimeloyl-ACP methyl ester carboxylesterase